MARYTCQECGCTVARGDAHLRTVLATDTTRFLQLVAWCPSCFSKTGG